MKKLILGCLILLMIGGCAVSRAYKIDVREGSCVTIYLDGFEVYKEGVNESQEADGSLVIPGVP